MPPYWAGLGFGAYPTRQGIISQIGAAVFVIGSSYLAEAHKKRERMTRVGAGSHERRQQQGSEPTASLPKEQQ
jgi:hypothetical protein